MDTEIELIIKIVSWCLTGISSLIALLVGIRKGKYKGLFKSISAVVKYSSKIVELVEEAETHSGYTSDDKLTFVLTKFQAYCIEENAVYDEEEAKAKIEELITLSKTVNTIKNKSLNY